MGRRSPAATDTAGAAHGPCPGTVVPYQEKLAPEPCCSARFLARIERRCARQIGSGHPWRRVPVPRGRGWRRCRRAWSNRSHRRYRPQGRAGGAKVPGSPDIFADTGQPCPVPAKLAPDPCSGASFLAQVPGRCQEAGTGAVFPGTGQTVGGQRSWGESPEPGVVSYIDCYATIDNRALCELAVPVGNRPAQRRAPESTHPKRPRRRGGSRETCFVTGEDHAAPHRLGRRPARKRFEAVSRPDDGDDVHGSSDPRMPPPDMEQLSPVSVSVACFEFVAGAPCPTPRPGKTTSVSFGSPEAGGWLVAWS